MTAQARDAPLVASGLHRTFEQGATTITAVAGIDLQVNAGEFVAIMGPSGSGKSTLLHMLGSLERPTSGTVTLEGREISPLADHELAVIRRRRIGFMMQFFSLLPTMTVLENVSFPLELDGRGDEERSREVIAAVGLTARADHRPSELSGGEQQRAALARALVARPAIVLADEPTGSLDSTAGLAVLELLRRSADGGQAIVIVTHDAAAAEHADRVLRLVDGKAAEPDASIATAVR